MMRQDYFAIEKLKESIQNKSKNSNIISKVNTLSIIQDNKNNKLNHNQMDHNETKKIISLKKNKIDSRLFFNYKQNKQSKLEEKNKVANNNKIK